MGKDSVSLVFKKRKQGSCLRGPEEPAFLILSSSPIYLSISHPVSFLILNFPFSSYLNLDSFLAEVGAGPRRLKEDEPKAGEFLSAACVPEGGVSKAISKG